MRRSAATKRSGSPDERGPPESGPRLVLGSERGNGSRVGQSPASLCSPVPGVDSAGRPNQCGA